MKQFLQLSLVFALFLIPCRAQKQDCAAAAGPAAKLAERVKAGEYESILEAGRSGAKTIIPYLKALVLHKSNRIVSENAQVALAKLGEKEYLNQILAEIDSNNPDMQDKAMKKLSLVGGREAFRKFHQLLDDTAGRENPQCKINVENFRKNNPNGGNCGLCCDVVFFSRSSTAMLFLSRMVAHPPTKNIGRENLRIWKEWFARNKHLIE